MIERSRERVWERERIYIEEKAKGGGEGGPRDTWKGI